MFSFVIYNQPSYIQSVLKCVLCSLPQHIYTLSVSESPIFLFHYICTNCTCRGSQMFNSHHICTKLSSAPFKMPVVKSTFDDRCYYSNRTSLFYFSRSIFYWFQVFFSFWLLFIFHWYYVLFSCFCSTIKPCDGQK